MTYTSRASQALTFIRGGVAALALITLPAQAASLLVDYDLAANQDTTVWTDLTNENPTLTPDSGSGTLSASGASPLSIGLYGMASYSITLHQTSAFDIQSAVFQLDVAVPSDNFPYNGGPLLSFNGGSQNIAATLFALGDSETRGFEFYGAAWQWDLSGFDDEITSITITMAAEGHTGIAGARIDTGDSFIAVVPEPSMGLMALLGSGLLVARRRRH